MKHIYITFKIVFVAVLSLVFVNAASAQSQYQPYSYQFDQKLNAELYSPTIREHTALKSSFIDSARKPRYDSLMNYGADNKSHDLLYRKLFNEHLIDYKGRGSAFYADVLPEAGVGRDFAGKLTTSTLSLGLQLGGTIGKEFSYNVAGYQSNAVVPDYMATYIAQTGVVPGMASARTYGVNGYAWSYVTASVSFTPIKYLNIETGRDKNFIGDGYRSLLLSNYASPYPYFKLTGTLGNVKYMVMWTYMDDPAYTSQYGVERKKFGVFHYLDWNVTNRLSLGFFENIMGFYTDDNGAKRPFDFNYINPVIFLKPVNNASDDPDKSLLGLNGKYKISSGITVYGQFALNEFVSKDFFSNDGASDNKYAWQLGLRGAHLFGIENLTYLLENNNARPYTYSARSAIENYSESGESLAHPWGANFREVVGLLNYSYKRFDFSGEADYGRYGLDQSGLNYGKDIFQVYTSAVTSYGNYIGQGLTTNMFYLDGKVAYLLNPKYNLRIEFGGIYRQENNSAFHDKTAMLTIGLRSSFRQFYSDLASYKTH
jgi:hypothetical protein